MPIILRKIQPFPIMREDGSFVDVMFATLAAVDDDGRQYSQVNWLASEVSGLSEGDMLALSNHDDIDWHQLCDDLTVYAMQLGDDFNRWNNEKVVEIIKLAISRPLEAVKAEPRGLVVADDHAEMIISRKDA